MVKMNESRPERQNIFIPNVSGLFVSLVKYGILRLTVPVTLSILRDDADQDGSFLLIDSASTNSFHKKSQGEPAAPLPASVIRRVFFCLSILYLYTNNFLSLEGFDYKRPLFGGCN